MSIFGAGHQELISLFWYFEAKFQCDYLAYYDCYALRLTARAQSEVFARDLEL